MKNRRFGLPLVVVMVLTAVLLAWLGPTLSKKTPNPSEPAVARANSRNNITATGQLTAKGVVESIQDIALSSQLKGKIAIVAVDEGTMVTAGQLLVKMDDKKMHAQVELAKARLQAAQAELQEQTSGFRREDVAAAQSAVDRAQAIFDQAQIEAQRQQRLLGKGAIARSDWEQAEEKYRVALAQLNELKAQADKLRSGFRAEAIERARAQVAEATAELNYDRAVLSDYTVYSPINGLVIRRSVDPGETVDIGTPLLSLIDPRHLRIHTEIEETDAGKVADGQAVEVTADNHPGEIFTGKVYQVFPTVAKKNQRDFDPMVSFDIDTQKVYVALDNYTGLVHGMTVTVRFIP